MTVLDILKMSGSLPVNELSLRSPGSAAQLLNEMTGLQDSGLIEVQGPLPSPENVPDDDRQVHLTRAGLRRSLAR